MTRRIAIIGGGIAGLAAAYRLRRAMDEGADVDFVLYEKDERLGGKILTEKVDGFVIDAGPDCYLSQKPWVARFAGELGIRDQLAPSNDAKKKTYIYVERRFHELPDGVMMMVPTKFWPFATTSLFSWGGKLRMGMDLFIPRREGAGDETLASFVTRRLGRECLDRLAEPLVGGVHASDPETMSLAATFPRFLEMEDKYGSVIRGFLAARRSAQAPPAGAQGGSPGGTSDAARPRPTFFMTLREGMQQLTDAAADAAGRGSLHTGAPVEVVTAEGDGYRLEFSDGRERMGVDAVVIATEAWAASAMLAPLDAEMGATLAEIPHSSSATVSVAFKRADVAYPLDAFGFVVPAVAGRRIMASTFSSTKWFGRADEDHVLLRAFVGGPHSQHLLENDDAGIVELVRAEWRDMLGIAAEPVLARVYRWTRGMPQYTLGHLDRVASLEAGQTRHPGLFLAGGSYRGVGIGDCIDSGTRAAEAAIAGLVPSDQVGRAVEG